MNARLPQNDLGPLVAVVRDPPPPEFEALLERRRRLGLDVLDEVWEGVYVIRQVPADWHADVAHQLAVIFGPLARQAGLLPLTGGFNVGEPDDYRVPDGGLLAPGPDGLYMPTAELVVEIVAPGDGTWEKLGFYAKHHVDELVVVDPQHEAVQWLARGPDGAYIPAEGSRLIDLKVSELAASIDWPPFPDQ